MPQDSPSVSSAIATLGGAVKQLGQEITAGQIAKVQPSSVPTAAPTVTRIPPANRTGKIIIYSDIFTADICN